MGFFDFVGDIASNIFGNNQAKKLNQANIAAQERTNAQNIAFQEKANAENFAHQDRTNQNAIQWRVADALAAGIHPLYAMGNPGISSMPSAVGPSLTAPRSEFSYDGGSAFKSMGQNLDRAINSMMTKSEREDAKIKQGLLDALTLERGHLENSKLRAEIALADRTHIGPAAPSERSVSDVGAMELSPESGAVQYQPSRVVTGSPGAPNREPGRITASQFQVTGQGGVAILPSKDSKERTEDDIFQQLGWNLRETLGQNQNPYSPQVMRQLNKEFPLPSNQAWRWDWLTQQYKPAYKDPRGGFLHFVPREKRSW